MMRLFKYLKEYKLGLILLITLLGLRAYTELELPCYTSDIVNIGIAQNGIKNSIPEEISKNSLENLELFMNEDEINTINKSYSLENDKYTLNNLDEKDVDKVNKIFKETTTLLMGAEGQNIPIENIKKGVNSGLINKDTLLKQKEDALNKLGDQAETITKHANLNFIKNEYKNIGIDVDNLRFNYLVSVSLKMLFVTLISGIASVFTNLITSKISSKVAFNLREKTFEKVLSFPKQTIDKFSIASLITRSTNDIQQIQMALNMMLFIAFYAPIMAILGIYNVAKTDLSMWWTIALGLAFLSLAIGTIIGFATPKFKLMQVLVDKVNLVSREILTGVSVIRIFGREKYEEKRFDKSNIELKENQLFVNRAMSVISPAISFVINAIVVLIIWVGGKSIDAGNIEVGNMMAFITYAIQIFMSFVFLTFLFSFLPRATVAAARIDEILEQDIDIKDKELVLDNKLEEIKGNLEFDNVTFTFDNADDSVITDVYFVAEAGKTTAIIGSTGSGKSTLLHLIPRFFDNQKGQIKIDGIDIKDISLKKLRDIIGFVPQKGVLFSGDIESNIQFGNNNISKEDIEKAAEISQSMEFIDSKENKFKSHIAQGGNNVSGGQKQRLSIARALAKKPKILLFDDSFSALDYKTDVKLRRQLKEEMKDVTTIIVAQRIATIINADKIVVLNEGKVVGIGKHYELLKNCPTYIEIAQSQMSEYELEKGGLNNE